MFNYHFYIPRPDRYLKGLRFRVRPVNFDAALTHEILARYDLAQISNPRNLNSQGRRSSIIVQSAGMKLFLKQYPATTSLPMIIHEHSILQFLASENFPSPRLITTPGGETFVSRGIINYALFEYIEGGIHFHNYLWLPSQTMQFITSAGATLAQLHKLLENFLPAGQNPYGFKSRTEGRWRGLDWYLAMLADCVQETQGIKTKTSSQLNNIYSHAGYIEKTLVNLEDKLNSASLPLHIIHSDYGPYNLLLRPDLPITILDFEIARLDWRLGEFAYALPRFANHERPSFNFAKAKAFIDAYRLLIPLNDDELQNLPEVWQYLKIRQAIIAWDNYLHTQSESRLRDAENYIHQALWANQHHADLVNNLTIS